MCGNFHFERYFQPISWSPKPDLFFREKETAIVDVNTVKVEFHPVKRTTGDKYFDVLIQWSPVNAPGYIQYEVMWNETRTAKATDEPKEGSCYDSDVIPVPCEQFEGGIMTDEPRFMASNISSDFVYTFRVRVISDGLSIGLSVCLDIEEALMPMQVTSRKSVLAGNSAYSLLATLFSRQILHAPRNHGIKHLRQQDPLYNNELQTRGRVRRQVDSGTIRLVYGNDTSGRVEVYLNGAWGTVCDDLWDLADADVACRQLGFTGATSAFTDAFFGGGRGLVQMDNVECMGGENRLVDCKYVDYTAEDCEHYEDAGVACYLDTSSAENGTLRLAGGSSSAGRVEVYLNGQWGTVCDDIWNRVHADVVCRQLGFNGSIDAFTDAFFGPGTGRIHMDDVECSGLEARLVDCMYNTDGNCDHSEDASVLCVPDGSLESGAIRLSNGNGISGRVEVYLNGAWGTVCNDFWDQIDADVACRQLGFTGAIAALDAFFGPGVGLIQLDDVECIGNEIRLVDCASLSYMEEDCDHSEDIGVECYLDTGIVFGALRLANGNISAGRLEVYLDGQWGTICDDSWSITEGDVACRQLGFSGAHSVHGAAFFGQGVGPINMDEVDCIGTETYLIDCAFTAFPNANCGHHEDAGVVCVHDSNTAESGAIRLVNGDNASGRVEIYLNGVWGTVCDDFWDLIDADVACRQLGFTGAIFARSGAFFGPGVGLIQLDDVECIGNESRLVDCAFLYYYEGNCDHDEDAGVECYLDTGTTVEPMNPGEPNPTESSAISTVVLIAIGAGSLLLILVLMVVTVVTFVCVCVRRTDSDESHQFQQQYTNQAFMPGVNRYERPVEPVFRNVEIPAGDNIKLGVLLGSGQYGEVFRGKARLCGQTSWTEVAIKKPMDFLPDEVMEDFRDEIRLMLELGNHPNIANVLGCTTKSPPFCLLTNYMKYGDLLNFLKKAVNKENWEKDPIYKITVLNQLQIARQITAGMSHVSGTRFFHGDLAARNILVGENLNIRITDFGLTDDLYQKEYTRIQSKAKRPYKWYSPESIEQRFCTTKTDIWSFGVLMWEVVTFGQQSPYHGMSIQEVVYRLKRGYRLVCPRKTPKFMVKIIHSCWQFEPDQRPEFAELQGAISFLLEKGSSDANYVVATEEDDTSYETMNDTAKQSLITKLNLDAVDASEVSGSNDSAFLGGDVSGMVIPRPL